MLIMTVLLSTLPLLLSCARNGFSPQDPLPALERGFTQERLVFRHKVTLDISGQPSPRTFDGVMRLDGQKQTAEVVGLGGMGLTLFSMTVSPDSSHTTFLHPSLARVPNIEDQIALCVRSLWFDTLALAAKKDTPERETLREFVHGVPLEHVFVKGHVVESRSTSGKNRWTATLSSPFSPGMDWPKEMSFRHEKPDYTITIRLVSVTPEPVEAK